MGKITPTILLIVISLVLSGCIDSGGGSATKLSSLLGGSDDSMISFYSSPGAVGDSGSGSGGSVSGGLDLGPGSGTEGYPNPEPASLALLGSGLLGLLGAKLRNRKR